MIVANIMTFGRSYKNLLYDRINVNEGFSLIKKKREYTSPILKVRRSSDNTEQDIYFNNLGLLDETSLLVFVGGGNGFVSIWYNQEFPNDLTKCLINNETATQPLIVSSGVIAKLNGKNCIDFTNNGKLHKIHPSLSPKNDYYNVFFVGSRNANGVTLIGNNGYTIITSGYVILEFLNAVVRFRNNNAGGSSSVTETVPLNTQVIVSSINNAFTEMVFYKRNNLVEKSVSVLNENTNTSGFNKGYTVGNSFSKLKINELIVFSQDNTEAERLAITTELNSEYNTY